MLYYYSAAIVKEIKKINKPGTLHLYGNHPRGLKKVPALNTKSVCFGGPVVLRKHVLNDYYYSCIISTTIAVMYLLM